ncbi:hypothetical protein E3E26_08950 [Thermococcus sp. LS1]|uniref:hypothetical protein n=1 Tax=Thermococcus sp. LS1 TaxID=1638259 RepID=UPI00143C5ED5|nr:hypothetical protein [Thermococcus sp. LS1]NJD99902.1 hypothetical protein [Thermococcus sp. LS1]
MRWKALTALLLGLLILGLTASGAVATADFVNQTVNKTPELPSEFNPKKPGDEAQPEGAGSVIVEVGARAFGIAIPGLGEIVLIGTLAKILAEIIKYIQEKPIREFAAGFMNEIPAKKGDYIQVTRIKDNTLEIGYGYVKKKWFGLKKETVIVEHIITITKDEITAVDNLFTPKEFGELLAKAWMNGWDANKAKKLAEDFEKEYPHFGNIRFRGATLSCGAFDGGWVILDKEGAKHIIIRHILTNVYRTKDKFKYLSAQDIIREIKETIRNPDYINCGSKINGNQRIVLVRYSPKIGTKMAVVLEKVGKGWYRIVTAFPASKY